MVARNPQRVQQLIKVQLITPEGFTKVKSLLRRIGLNPKGSKRLYQTCHILRDGNEFYVCHFKELFWIEGRHNSMDALDIERRNRIISLLIEKKLIKAETADLSFSIKAAKSLFIVPFSEVERWTLCSKYKFRKSKRITPENGTIN